jgi:hypothetical protein
MLLGEGDGFVVASVDVAHNAGTGVVGQDAFETPDHSVTRAPQTMRRQESFPDGYPNSLQ